MWLRARKPNALFGRPCPPSWSGLVLPRWNSQKKATYFEPREWEQEEPFKPEAYFANLRDVFVRNLPRYFDGNERVGVSLTGGLDTRIIMAWSKASPGSLPCYTFGSMYRDNEDVRLARHVAKICGQSHHVITTGKEFLSQFSRYAERTIYLTDATVDLGRSPDLYVNEKAREIAPVRMVGTFGSEMLLHAVMFKAVEPVAGLYQTELLPQIHAARKTYDAIRQGHRVTSVAFRQSPWHHSGVLGLEQTQVTVRTPYLDNDFVKTVYKAPGPVAINEEARLRLIREGNPALANLRTDRGIGGVNSLFTRATLEFYSRLNTPTITACRSGLRKWTICLPSFTLNVSGSAATRPFIFECGIATSWQTMSVRCSWTDALSHVPISSQNQSEPLSGAISKATAITLRRFTGS